MLKVANSVIDASRITGVLPVVNGGTGVTTSTGTGNTVLSAAPTLSGNVTLSTGNLIIGTAGKGIDFSITSHPAGMTSELLADYEEGTFTPSLGGDTTYSTQAGRYTKIGNVCYFSIFIGVTLIGTGSTTAITGLPYTALYGSQNGVHAVYYDAIASSVSSLVGYVQSTTLNLASTLTPSSGIGPNPIFRNTADVRVQGWFFV